MSKVNVLVTPVATVTRGSARNVPLEITHKFKHAREHIDNVFALKIAGKDAIEARAATHGPEVHRALSPLGIVAQKRVCADLCARASRSDPWN